MKVSFDFDHTLTRPEIQEYCRLLISRGVDVWVTTFRDANGDNTILDNVINFLNIPKSKIIFTSNQPKSPYLKDKNFLFHIDDQTPVLEDISKNTTVRPIFSWHLHWRKHCEQALGFNYEILELFPTAMYASMVPDELGKEVVSFWETLEMSNESDIANYGHRSVNTYILHEPQCANLAKFVLYHANKYGKELLGYDYKELTFSQTWLTHKKPGQHHTMHTHPNSLISGVIFYGPHVDQTPALSFHKFTGFFGTPTIMQPMRPDHHFNSYGRGVSSIPHTPGLMVLFPSWFHHSVPINNTNQTRKTLAMNIVPKEGFGQLGSLTEMAFDESKRKGYL